MGVNVLLDLVELLPLVNGDLQQFPCDRRHDLPRPRRRADRRIGFDRIDVLPDDRLFGRHFEDGAVGTEQMSVLPLANRWAPEMKDEKKSVFLGAV